MLALQGPLTIYEIWRKLKAQRDFAYIRYHVINRRVRALEGQGYIENSGERRTKTGFMAMLYQLTARAYLAVLLNKINLDDFLTKASEDNVLSALACLMSADSKWHSVRLGHKERTHLLGKCNKK